MDNQYKCYNVSSGCMGQIAPGLYRLFATEAEYAEVYNEELDEDDDESSSSFFHRFNCIINHISERRYSCVSFS